MIEQITELINSNSYPVKLIVEPWGMVLDFPAYETYTVLIKAEIAGNLVIQFALERITIFGWPTSYITIKHKGEVIYE